ncbi:MAG: anthranilate phosphoribosyltransferase [Proteobacteria bacterium]|nr:anthranilate phosphoribosyltransferase [Pseudomonadota bacterium]
MTADDFRPVLEQVKGGKILSEDEAGRAFDLIMAGGVAEDDLAAFLLALNARQPAIPEIVGAARAMRRVMTSIEANPYAIDLCGTGGDAAGTFNISTACAFVVAACGVPVAKHGNRSMSSKSGTADCLEAVGVNIALSPVAAARCLREVGLCFMFAQSYHPAMKHVAPVRKRLGVRTIFNLLGPLCNPARVRRQLIGVYDKAWCEPVAEVLERLGTEHAWVVNGDGLDEMTIAGASHVAILRDGKVTTRAVEPEDAGVDRSSLEQLRGGDVSHNAQALMLLLEGEGYGAYRDIVVLNAAAALIVAGKASDLLDGASQAREAIQSGRALAKLNNLVAVSNA